MIPKIGPLELVIILVVVLLLFGPKNLPKLGSALGKTVKNLRDGLNDGKKAKDADEPKAKKKKVEKVEAAEEDEAEVVVEKPAPKSSSEEE